MLTELTGTIIVIHPSLNTFCDLCLIFVGISGRLRVIGPLSRVNIPQSTFRMCFSNLRPGPQIAPYKKSHTGFWKNESRLVEIFGRMNPGWRVTENTHVKTSSDSFFQKPLRDFLYQATICGRGRNLRPRPQVRITHAFFDLRNIDSRKGAIVRKRPQLLDSPPCAKASAPYIMIGLSPSRLCT